MRQASRPGKKKSNYFKTEKAKRENRSKQLKSASVNLE
jgi:hypothetical protein